MYEKAKGRIYDFIIMQNHINKSRELDNFISYSKKVGIDKSSTSKHIMQILFQNYLTVKFNIIDYFFKNPN